MLSIALSLSRYQTRENIKLRRYLKIDKTNNLYGYTHNNKIVSIVELKNPDEKLAKDICMHIVASNPLALDESSLDEEYLNLKKKFIKRN